MKDSLSALEACGIDTKEGIGRFMNSEKLFIRFLLRFLDDTGMENLMKSYKAGDVSECFRAAHSMKALTGNLAITCMYEKLKVMVEVLRKGEFPENKEFESLFQNYTDVVETLQEISHNNSL